MTAWQDQGAPQGVGAPVRGPTVRRILLGVCLRRLRETAGIAREAAGNAIRASDSKISRMELGRTSFKERDIADLLTLYGVTDDEERRSLLRQARESNTRAWWHRYGDMIPAWTHAYLDLEEAASSVRTYEPCQIPDVLQTEEYARTILSVGNGARVPQEEIEDRITVRLLRRRLFARSAGRELTAVMDEAALRRFVGGAGLIRRQVEHLAALSESAVDLRILPLGRTAISTVGQPFTVLRFEERDLPDVVFIELLATALYLDKPADAGAYERAWGRLVAEALPPDLSRTLLAGLVAEL